MMERIIVTRQGPTDNSQMQTLQIIGCIMPDTVYTIIPDHLESTSENETPNICISDTPPYIQIPNTWNTTILHDASNNNILGANGEFQVTHDLVIPIAETTSEYLAFYHCKLVQHGDHINFNTTVPLPVTNMQIGTNYMKDYLLTSLGGGCYLEYHDTPHFHMPLNEAANGYLILGKIRDNYCLLSAFRIPYVYAIYTNPGVIHCDACLVGDYLVVYTITEHFSTVILKIGDAIANISFS